MKYTILGFQQKKLIENNLTVEDAFILRTIKDMYASASMEFKTIENEKYMWINYSYLLEQIPIVGEKRNLMRRIEKYGSDLLIVRKLEFSRNAIKGKFSYIKPTEKLDSLEDFDLMTKSHKGYDKIAQGLCENDIRDMTKSHIKDTSIKYTSIKDNKTNIAEIENFFEECWKLYPCKKGKGQIGANTKKKLFKFGNEFKRCIERYVSTKEEWRKYQNGSTFFNSGYVDYLDINFKEQSEDYIKQKENEESVKEYGF